MLPFALPALGKQIVPIVIALIVVGGLVTTHLIKEDREASRTENRIKTAAAHQCNSDRLGQNNTALVKASEQSNQTLQLREAELADAAKAIENLENELGKLRNAKSSTDATPSRACLPADDPWLRHWQGRGGKSAAASPGRP